MNAPYPREITSYRDLRLFLDLDLKAHGLSRWTVTQSMKRPEIRFQRALRRAEWSRTLRGFGRALYAVDRLHLQRLSLLTGISIPLGVFGPGLSIAHYGSIVVNPNAKVGAFCRLHSATNLGSYQGLAPTLGDYVYVAPGAVIYGGANIGDRVSIGANAVVTGTIPSRSTAVGAPARILPDRDSSSAMPPWISHIMLESAPLHEEEAFA